ncbi:MAG: hypothetical protein HC874_26130 [Richelia sp. SL_2_1]|nr:hypothetical protein [Richelia sp. SL_2_1]
MYHDEDMPEIYANVTVGEYSFMLEGDTVDEITEELVEFLESVPLNETITIDVNNSHST